MTDQPKKTLSFKPPAPTLGIEPRATLTIKRTSAELPVTDKIVGTGSGEIVRSRTAKRIVRRDELPTAGLGRANPKAKPPTKPKPKQKKPARKPTPKKPVKSPSDLRAAELDASLNGFPVWLTRQPLTHGVEREIFRHIAELHLSASKRVVMKLIRTHTLRREYLLKLAGGGSRAHLDGSDGGAILPAEQALAAERLAAKPL